MVGDAQLDDLEQDRVHRSLRPKPSQGSQPVIVRYHKYTTKEHVLQWARKNQDIAYQVYSIRIFEDFSANLAKKQASFNKVSALQGWNTLRSALPCLTVNSQSRIFDSAEEAEYFYKQHKK